MWRMIAIGAGKINNNESLCFHHNALAIRQVEDALVDTHLKQTQFEVRIQHPKPYSLSSIQATHQLRTEHSRAPQQHINQL